MAWPSASRRPVGSSMVRTPPVNASDPSRTSYRQCSRTRSPIIDHVLISKHGCIHRSMTSPRQSTTSRHQGGLRLPRAARRAQIIETAAGAFLQAGFDGTSMEEVAQAAGVSRLVIYRIFDTTEHLHRAVLSSVTDAFVAEFVDMDRAEIRRRGGITRITLGIATPSRRLSPAVAPSSPRTSLRRTRTQLSQSRRRVRREPDRPRRPRHRTTDDAMVRHRPRRSPARGHQRLAR
jgi:AcrR family transcriptional regulator